MGFTVWFTGISGAGKSTLAKLLEAELRRRGMPVEMLDGDTIRSLMGNRMGFDATSRITNIRYLGIMSHLLNNHGVVALVAAISPYAEGRRANRELIAHYVEVFCDCRVNDAAHNDVKGLYARALRGEVAEFTGVTAPYEPPGNPEVHVLTYQESVERSMERLLGNLRERGLLPGQRRVVSHAADSRPEFRLAWGDAS